MTEGELLHEVMRYAAALGLLIHHCADSRHCHGSRGLPDLIILGPCGLLFAELKGPDGETSADQDSWLYHLHKIDALCGLYCGKPGPLYATWKPEHWEKGIIQARLSELAG